MRKLLNWHTAHSSTHLCSTPIYRMFQMKFVLQVCVHPLTCTTSALLDNAVQIGNWHHPESMVTKMALTMVYRVILLIRVSSEIIFYYGSWNSGLKQYNTIVGTRLHELCLLQHGFILYCFLDNDSFCIVNVEPYPANISLVECMEVLLFHFVFQIGIGCSKYYLSILMFP